VPPPFLFGASVQTASG
jgi:hypothetical protein